VLAVIIDLVKRRRAEKEYATTFKENQQMSEFVGDPERVKRWKAAHRRASERNRPTDMLIYHLGRRTEQRSLPVCDPVASRDGKPTVQCFGLGSSRCRARP
jgi:hypothetical protein